MCLVFTSECHNKNFPQIEWFKTTEVYSCKVLEEMLAGAYLPGSSGGESILAYFSSAWLLALLSSW